MTGSIARVVSPEVEVVRATVAVGPFSRWVPRIDETAVGAHQIDHLVGFIRVSRSVPYVPHEHTLTGHVAIVVGCRW